MPDGEISIRGKILRDVVAYFNSERQRGGEARSDEIRKRLPEPVWKCPDGYHNEHIQMPEFEMEYLCPDKTREDLVILQLHGGGYVESLKNVHKAESVLYSSAGKGCNVLTIDYRVAPENPYPAALEDAIAAYEWLIKKGFAPNQIVLAGDSAGGGLAMSLCMWLRDQSKEVPKGIVAMSPWTDLTCGGESYKGNYAIDPVFGNTRESLLYNNPYIGEYNPKEPYISPVFGDFKGFPPMLIQVGTHEMLLSDSIVAARKAKEDGVKVRFSQYEGMFHVFQRAMLLMPESKKAWVEVDKFIEQLAIL